MADAPEFSVETTVEGARTLVVLQGELDAYTATRLAEEFDQLGDLTGRHVMVDLASVGFVDSAGLSALVVCMSGVRDAGGVVSMRAVPRQLAKLFEITGLARLFPFE